MSVEITPETQQRFDLITRNLQEVLGGEKLKDQLARGKNIHVYWGTATTGRPHVGYLVPMRKIADLLQAGIRVTILFADLHAFLDNMKSTWELLENRVIYYENVIKALLQSLDIPIEKLHFVRGTQYQLSKEYTFDILRLCGQVTQRDALRAGAEVVKQVESPLLSGLLYPLLQAVDEQYLKVDGQFGGVDQRKIFILAEEQLPKLKLGKRWHLMNPMVPGLTGSKMSSSEENSKIDLLDAPSLVEAKISGAACALDSDDNGVLAFYEHVLLPIVLPQPICIGSFEYFSIAEIRNDFQNGKLTEESLKNRLHFFLNELLQKVQHKCDTPEIKAAIAKGYQLVPERTVNKVLDTTVELTKNQETAFSLISSSGKLFSESSLRTALASNKPLRVLIPIFCKGRFHLGYVVLLLYVKKLLNSGAPLQTTILLDDLIAFLDNEKVSWNAREGRAAYFSKIFNAILKALQIEDKVQIKRASNDAHNFSPDYVLEMYKMASVVTRDETALSEGTFLSGHLVPLIYALDVHYSDAQLVLLGEDEEATAKLAIKLWTQSLGVSGPAQLLLEPLVGMDEGKMSGQNVDSHLDVLDTAKLIKTKIARSFCEPQNTSRNVALTLARQIIFPLLNGASFDIKRSVDNGGDISINSFDELVNEFKIGGNPSFPLHPGDLKASIVDILNAFLNQIRPTISPADVSAAFPSKSGKGGKKK